MTNVVMMKSSPWVKPLLKKVNELEVRISSITDLIEEWIKC